MNCNNSLNELKRKQFYNNYKELENKMSKCNEIYINGVKYRIRNMSACFEESKLELGLLHIGEPLIDTHERKFKIGDRVKLNQPMPFNMDNQVPYRKYYDVVMIDSIDHNGSKLQVLGIDGVKGLIDARYFDLYAEYEKFDDIELINWDTIEEVK